MIDASFPRAGIVPNARREAAAERPPARGIRNGAARSIACHGLEPRAAKPWHGDCDVPGLVLRVPRSEEGTVMLRRRTQLPVAILVAALAAAPAGAEVETYFGFQIGIRSAPPPPTVVFVSEPKVVLVDETRVYVARDYDRDLFRYGGAWFLYSEGFWYRGASWRGPFRVVDVRVVPSAVLRVPPSRWKHHPHGGPPGLMKPASHGPRAHAKAVQSKESKGKRGKGRDR